MSRASSQKALQYCRAVYGDGQHPSKPFEALIRHVLKQLPKVGDTEIAMAGGEVCSIRHRDLASAGGLKLAIGAGVINESMSTMGVQVAAVQDQDQPRPPPTGRAFKLEDAYLLIDDAEIIVCLDGGMRLTTIDSYLRKLMDKGGCTPLEQTFSLSNRMDGKTKQTLKVEGIKAVRLKGTAYAASQVLDKDAPDLSKGWQKQARAWLSLFEDGMTTQAERDSLAANLGEVNITTEIQVRGGGRGKDIVLKGIDAAARAAADEDTLEAEVILITKKGTEISSSSLTLRGSKTIRRMSGQNDLDFADAWSKLGIYRQDLIDTKRWKT